MSQLFQGAPLSGARQISPFGQLPFGLAGGEARQLEGLMQLFGFGPRNPAQARHQADLLGRGGPLASFASEVRGFAPGVIPEAEMAGERVATAGSQAFQTLTDQVNRALTASNTFAREAFDPALETPFFNEAFRRAVQPARSAASARGLLDSGPGQASEDELSRRLTTDFASQQLGMQAQVPGLLTAPAQVGLEAVPRLGEALSSQYNMPLGAAGNVLSLLQSQQSPALQLLGLTAPHDRPFSGTGKFGAQKTG